MIFTSLAFAQVGQALATRSSHASLFSIGLRSNPLMFAERPRQSWRRCNWR